MYQKNILRDRLEHAKQDQRDLPHNIRKWYKPEKIRRVKVYWIQLESDAYKVRFNQ